MPVTVPHLELLVPEDSMAPFKGKFPERAYDPKGGHYAAQPEMRAAYAGMITRLDRDVGRVLALLDELKLAEDTIVFFTSDNGSAQPLYGESFFESTHGLRGHKQNFYEGGIRVPMVARWPGRIPKNSSSGYAWGFWDVLPTLCELAGAKVPGNIDGRSIVPTLMGKQQSPEPLLYWELPRYNAKTGTFFDELPPAAARMSDWKAVRPKPNAALELYNLLNDPYEQKDVASQYPKIVERMEATMRAARVPPRPQPHPEPDFRKKA
jgi:arylsulfatase A-like enzyme